MNYLFLVVFTSFALILLPSVYADSNIQQTLFDVILSPKDFDAQGPNHQILILNANESASIPIKIVNRDSIPHQISFGIPYPDNISNLVESYSFDPQTIKIPTNSESQTVLHIQVKNNTDSHWGTFDFFAQSKIFGVVGKSFYIVIGDKEKPEIDPFIDHSMRVDLPGPAFSQMSKDFPQDQAMLTTTLDKMMPDGFVSPRYVPEGYKFEGQSTPSPYLGLVYAPFQVTNMTESVDFWQSGGLLIYSEEKSPNFNLTSWVTAYSAQNDAKEIMINGARGIATAQQERVVAYDEAKYKFPAELVLFYGDTELEMRGNLPLDELIKITSSMKSVQNELHYKLISPLQQFKAETREGIKCKSGLELLRKASNGLPACVTSETKTELLKRGWGSTTWPFSSVQENKISCDSDTEKITPGPYPLPSCPMTSPQITLATLNSTGFASMHQTNLFASADNYVLEPGHNGTIYYSLGLYYPAVPMPFNDLPQRNTNLTNYAQFIHYKRLDLKDLEHYPDTVLQKDAQSFATCFETPYGPSCRGEITTSKTVNAFVYDHPGVNVYFDKKSEFLTADENTTLAVTFSATKDAKPGTYVVILPPGVCSGGLILLTIGNYTYQEYAQ